MEPDIESAIEPKTVAPGGTLEAVEHASAAHHGEPWYADPYVAVTTGFILFMAVYARFIHPLIVRGLDGRATKIRTQLEQAEQLRIEAEALLADYKKRQKAVKKEAEAIVANARKEAESLRAKAAEDLKQTLARRTAQAEEQIARAEADATARIRAQMVDIATEAARQIVTDQLSGQKDDPTISRALSFIARQLH